MYAELVADYPAMITVRCDCGDLMAAQVLGITRSSGVAGSYAYTARVQYPGELPSMITFAGSAYGPPIVMVMPGGAQAFVSRGVLDRIGDKLDPAWVRAFFAD